MMQEVNYYQRQGSVTMVVKACVAGILVGNRDCAHHLLSQVERQPTKYLQPAIVYCLLHLSNHQVQQIVSYVPPYRPSLLEETLAYLLDHSLLPSPHRGST